MTPSVYIELIISKEKESMDGLGIAMIRFVEYIRDRLGKTSVQLSPISSTKGWYKKLGFKDTGVDSRWGEKGKQQNVLAHIFPKNENYVHVALTSNGNVEVYILEG